VSTPQPPFFTYTRRVQFAETDLAGIVHFSMFFRYLEEAEHAMWRAAGIKIAGDPNGYHWPRVGATCDFKRALRFEDEFEVRIRVAQMRSRTIHYACDVVCNGAVAATGTMTSACVRLVNDRMTATEIPEYVKAALTRVTAA
jgi:YbgC/YbaW family acyl-CoA thioester hydrolase